MGRHSAPDDDYDDESSGTFPVSEVESARAAQPSTGQHSWVSPFTLTPSEPSEHSADSMETDVLPFLEPEVQQAEVAAAVAAEEPPVVGAEERPATPEPGPPAPRESGTHADLRLLREDSALRARCAAGVVVPFLLYLGVLIVVGRLDAFLLWVWIPAVTAGIVVGTFLDVAHQHRTQRPST